MPFFYLPHLPKPSYVSQAKFRSKLMTIFCMTLLAGSPLVVSAKNAPPPNSLELRAMHPISSPTATGNVHSKKTQTYQINTKSNAKKNQTTTKNLKDESLREESAESANLALNILVAELMTKDQPAEVWENYTELAKKHQNPWFAKRAFEVASQFKNAGSQTKESLELWQNLEEKAPNIEANIQNSKNPYNKKDDVQQYLVRKIDLNKQLTLQAFAQKNQTQSMVYFKNYLTLSQQLLNYNLKLVDYKYKKNTGFTELSATEAEKAKTTDQNKERDKAATQLAEIESWLGQIPANDSAYLKSTTTQILEQLNAWPASWQISALKIALLQKIDMPAAKNEAQKARQLYPDSYELELNHILLLEPTERIQALAELAKKKPDDRRAHIFYLRNLFGVNRLNEAQAHINKLLEQSAYQQDFEIHFLLAQIYRMQQKPEQAVALIEDLAANNRQLPDALYLFMNDILKSSKKEGDQAKALEWLEKANLETPQRMQLIAEYLKQKNFDAAARQLKIIERDLTIYDKSLFYSYTTDLWIFYQQPEQAIDQLEKLITVQPKNYQAHLVLANLYIKQQKTTTAIDILKKAIAVNSKNPVAYNFLAYTYAENSSDPTTLDEGIEYIQKALTLAPDEGAYQDTLGWLYFKKKDLNNAKPWLEKAWNNEKEVEIGAHLLETYHLLGMKTEAQALKSFLLELVEKNKSNQQKDLAVLENMLKLQSDDNQRENETLGNLQNQQNKNNPDNKGDSSPAQAVAQEQAFEKMKQLRGQIAFKTSEQIQELKRKQKQSEEAEAKLKALIERLKI